MPRQRLHASAFVSLAGVGSRAIHDPSLEVLQASRGAALGDRNAAVFDQRLALIVFVRPWIIRLHLQKVT
jgi:hypothetical protein